MTVCKYGNVEIEVDNIVGDDGKETLHFRHPLTGEWCQSIDKVLDDMKKYYEKKKTQWTALAGHIKTDSSLKEAVSFNAGEKEYV